jgi:hypothetical protein
VSIGYLEKGRVLPLTTLLLSWPTKGWDEMAKLSARGAHEIAKVAVTTEDEFGKTRMLFALRSDGKILRRFPPGGYSVWKTLKPTAAKTEETLRRVVRAFGYVPDDEREIRPLPSELYTKF